MVLALAVTVTALACLVVGALIAIAWTRRLFAASPKAFRCKIGTRVSAGAGKHLTTMRWPWIPSYAVWVHDSLVVVSGLVRTRIRPLAVHFAEGAVGNPHNYRLSGIGPDPVFLTLELDDGSQVVLAAPRSVRSLVAGPYLAALLTVPSPSPGGGRA
jgi:hypothetical protein